MKGLTGVIATMLAGVMFAYAPAQQPSSFSKPISLDSLYTLVQANATAQDTISPWLSQTFYFNPKKPLEEFGSDFKEGMYLIQSTVGTDAKDRKMVQIVVGKPDGEGYKHKRFVSEETGSSGLGRLDYYLEGFDIKVDSDKNAEFRKYATLLAYYLNNSEF